MDSMTVMVAEYSDRIRVKAHWWLHVGNNNSRVIVVRESNAPFAVLNSMA